MKDTDTVVHDLCEAAVDHVLGHVNTLQYLIKSIEEISGKPFMRERFKCISSSTRLAGGPRAEKTQAGYMWRNAPQQSCNKGDVVLLEDGLFSPNELATARTCKTTADMERHFSSALHRVEKDLRHECIHAFDDARGEVDPSNCLHQACSEIRAARFSGDCFTGEEMSKGRLNFTNNGRACVERRAVLSVESNPICRGFSERAVEKMFPRCYYDYEPYAAPIFSMGSHGRESFTNGTSSSLSKGI